MASNSPQEGLYVGLVKAAQFFTEKMFDRIDSNGLPKVIKDATSIGDPNVSSDKGYVDVTIDTSEDGAPMAAAFEYGSGVHGDEGEEYPITHRESGRALQIPRDRFQSYTPEPPKYPDRDPLYFMKVMHPGVKARPYIRPTIIENKEEIAKIIGREFVASISLGGKVTIIK